MKRRSWILGGVALAAGAAGVAWQQSGESRRRAGDGAGPTDAAALPSAPAAAASASADVWQLRFDQPGGDTLALDTLRGRPLLMNFWATWCPPCLKELPMLDEFARANAPRWRVVGLAIDREQSVRDFLARTPLGFPVGLAGITGSELMRSLGNGAGALPFSVAFDSQGAPRKHKLGELTPADLDTWARELA